MIAETWSQVPVDKPIYLIGANFDALENALDPLPNDSPLIFGYKSEVDVGFLPLVGDIIALLEQSAVDMFPAWLPGAANLIDVSPSSLREADRLARLESRRSGGFAPYVCALTRTALGGHRSTANFSREVQTDQLSRILKQASGRRSLALLLQIHGDGPAGRDLELAADWLARHGRMGVWITGSTTERFPQCELRVYTLPIEPTATEPVDKFSEPRSGSPRADSDAERLLEEALRSHKWSVDREWNKIVRVGTLLTSPVCVDLVWQSQMLVIEIDGDEHRGSGKYAADRRRDNMLQLRGYMTLRYTNGQIMHDLAAVVAQIRTAVETTQNIKHSEGSHQMSTDDLTINEILVLLVLMSENRTVRNTELKNFGPTLDANSRKKLDDLDLIESSKPARFIELSLTQAGWDFCTDLFSSDTPGGANPATRTAFTMMRGFERYMARNELVPAQIFNLPDPVAGRIREMYQELADRPGAWVGLHQLRAALPSISRADLDAGLLELQRQQGVSLIPEENQKTLTDGDRRAALVVGTQKTHLLAIAVPR